VTCRFQLDGAVTASFGCGCASLAPLVGQNDDQGIWGHPNYNVLQKKQRFQFLGTKKGGGNGYQGRIRRKSRR
jgi:hypothetical protein